MNSFALRENAIEAVDPLVVPVRNRNNCYDVCFSFIGVILDL